MNIEAMEICSQNSLDKYSNLLVLSGSANKNYMFDNETQTYWQSDTGLDTQTETITIEFRDFNQNDITCDIDRIILQNTNVKYLTAQAVSLDDATHDIIITQAQNLNGENVIIDFTALPPEQLAKKIIISLHTTQTPNEKKKIGQLRICKRLITLDDVLVNLNRSDEIRSGDFRTIDGSLTGWKDWEKFAGELALSNVSKTKKTSIEEICSNHDFINLIYFNDAQNNLLETIECKIVSSPNFAHDRLTNLYETILILKGR